MLLAPVEFLFFYNIHFSLCLSVAKSEISRIQKYVTHVRGGFSVKLLCRALVSCEKRVYSVAVAQIALCTLARYTYQCVYHISDRFPTHLSSCLPYCRKHKFISQRNIEQAYHLPQSDLPELFRNRKKNQRI